MIFRSANMLLKKFVIVLYSEEFGPGVVFEPGVGSGPGISECWPKKNLAKTGHLKWQNFLACWPKKSQFFDSIQQKPGPKMILVSHFCIHDLFSSFFC